MGSIIPPCSTTTLSHHQPSIPYLLATHLQTVLDSPAANSHQVLLPCDPISSDNDTNYNMSSQPPVNPNIALVEQCDQTKLLMLTSSKVSA